VGERVGSDDCYTTPKDPDTGSRPGFA